ncbi:hypothetical protein ONZ45_g3663 [Pleurotus djamor]|nr:hypothetical protein ONZ45_g3663 [Pleurotus djamor]
MRLLFLFSIILVLATTILAWEKEDHEIFDLVSELEAAEGKGTTFYSWLDVPSTASTSEISKAYRKLSMQLHPDKNPGVKGIHERFARLGVITAILRKAESRARYDFFYKNGVPKWRGTGYYYSRFRPGLGTVLVFLTILSCGLQYIIQHMSYGNHLKRIEHIVQEARLAAWGPKMIPGEGEKRVKVSLGGSTYDEDGYVVPGKTISMVVRGQDVWIRNPDGSEEPINASTAPKPALSQTWFPALIRSAVNKVLRREQASEKLDDGADALSNDDEDTDSGSVSQSEKSRSATPTAKVGGKRRKAILVYRRYASLFFVCGISTEDNELIALEIIHRYVEILDRYFGNVCELDLIFNFQKAYAILDELIIAGELQESSKKSVLRVVTQSDSVEEQENSEDTMARLGSRSG